jgi:hypothetical protein
MANQTKTFDLNEHMHSASNSGDDHLKFGNLSEDSSHKLVQFQHQMDHPLLKA